MEQSDNEGQGNKFINSGKLYAMMEYISNSNVQDYNNGNRIVDVG